MATPIPPVAGAPAIPPAAPAAVTPAAPAAPPEPQDWQAEAEKWKALSRQNETQAKANADAAKELQAIKDSQLTEAQKLQKAVDDNAAIAANATAELARYKVAAAKGVPPELLSGSTEAELTAQADALIAFAGGQVPTPPVLNLGQGQRGNPAAQTNDPNAWIRAQMGR